MKENEKYSVNVRIIAPDLPDEFVSAIKKLHHLEEKQDQDALTLPLQSEQTPEQK